MTFSIETRINNELSYLHQLLHTKGNAKVPDHCIASYLRTQAIWFDEIHMAGYASDLRLAAEYADQNNWDAAIFELPVGTDAIEVKGCVYT